MTKKQIDKAVRDCKACNLSLLEWNNCLKSDIGYGKLVGKEGDKSNDIMVVGLNPSRSRYPGLNYPFDADCNAENKKNVGAIFMLLLQTIGVYENCYVTNLIKCSTDNNKVDKIPPHCHVHFLREVDHCRPIVILACGNQVYDELKKSMTIGELSHRALERIYHPNYCFSYHRMTPSEYLAHVKGVTDKYGY